MKLSFIIRKNTLKEKEIKKQEHYTNRKTILVKKNYKKFFNIFNINDYYIFINKKHKNIVSLTEKLNKTS